MPQDAPHTNVVVLGSTGSVGRSALGVIAHDGGARLKARGLGANTSVGRAGGAGPGVPAALHRPGRPRRRGRRRRPVAGVRHRGALRAGRPGPDGEDPETDRVLSAIVGAAGLQGTWAALEAGKIVALANKETLVVAGPLVMELARRRGGTLLPVDSEHSAIFQALRAGATREVRRVILTSSGGPFRGRSRARAGGRHPRGGAPAPDLEDGAEDLDRLGHPDEQGARGHRGPLALRPPARPDRGGRPPRERGPLDGRVRRRQRGGPDVAART